MNLEEIKDYYKKNNIPIEAFNLIGFRDSSGMKKDLINDKLGFWTDSELFLVPGTTDPGVYWTESGERNKAGTFHLLTGYHPQIWTFGKHKGYDAFVNDYKACKPTRGWRDSNFNYLRDRGDIEVCGYFGVNFHRMHESLIAKVIGKYSAGCQVIQNPKDFSYIYKRAKESGQRLFSYMLFEA